ncbi:hypothetical protein V8G54_028039 [Vigna mungo]|uniref:Ubiquitin-like protease family profile domain-containing protein n=1 Tax=Vigna mungo TaxID=3915 RepID=A0AAQ3MS04_VIGMU
MSTFERTENEEIKESLPFAGETNFNSNNDNFDFVRVVEEQRLLRRMVDNHLQRLLELQRSIRHLEEEVFNEMPSFDDGMEGPSTYDKGRDLTIVNFVDGGMEGPSTNENIDFSNVYTTCTSVLCNDDVEVLVEVSNNMLTRADFKCLRPLVKIENMVMLFATGMIMYNQLHLSGMISRCCFNPFFATMTMEIMKIPKKKREPLAVIDYHHLFQPESSALNVLLTSKFLFVPIVGDDHWLCYVVNCQLRELFILDSCGHRRRSRKKFDKAMVVTLQELFNTIDIESNYKEQELNVIEEDLPEQLQVVQEQMVCQWVLHEDNVHRSKLFASSRSQRVQEKGHDSFDVDMVNTLLSIFLAKGKVKLDLQIAWAVVAEMGEKFCPIDIGTYNMILQGLGKMGRADLPSVVLDPS